MGDPLRAQHCQRGLSVTSQLAEAAERGALPTRSRASTAPKDAILPNIVAILSAPAERGSQGVSTQAEREMNRRTAQQDEARGHGPPVVRA